MIGCTSELKLVVGQLPVVLLGLEQDRNHTDTRADTHTKTVSCVRKIKIDMIHKVDIGQLTWLPRGAML